MTRRLGRNKGEHPAQDATSLELHIEELVLHGFDHLDRAELGTVVEQALNQLFTERGVPPALKQGGSIDSLDGGRFTAQPDTGAHEVGGQIAQAIYRSFGS